MPSLSNSTVRFQSTRPVWGATQHRTRTHPGHRKFQSTRPVWGATRHAEPHLLPCQNFNPRAPCGARPLTMAIVIVCAGFQSTRPVWGATVLVFSPAGDGKISIHAPRVGRDGSNNNLIGNFRDFNPRAPCGARPGTAPLCRAPCRYFNPRAPCGARRVGYCLL